MLVASAWPGAATNALSSARQVVKPSAPPRPPAYGAADARRPMRLDCTREAPLPLPPLGAFEMMSSRDISRLTCDIFRGLFSGCVHVALGGLGIRGTTPHRALFVGPSAGGFCPLSATSRGGPLHVVVQVAKCRDSVFCTVPEFEPPAPTMLCKVGGVFTLHACQRPRCGAGEMHQSQSTPCGGS